MPELPYAWSCLECRDGGAGAKSDLAARKHEDASKHATTTHLERAAWSEPLLVGEVLPTVVARMAARDWRAADVKGADRETIGARPQGASTPAASDPPSLSTNERG